MQDSEKPNSSKRAHYDNDDIERDGNVSPAHGGPGRAILIGAIAGIIGAIINIAITLLSSPVYQQAAQEGAKTLSSVDYIVTGLSCLSIFINLLVCYIAGWLTGKVTRRQVGFYAGAAAGVVMFLCSFITNWIPNYPGSKIATQGATTAGAFSGGLLVSFIFLMVWLFIGGLIGLWAAGRNVKKYAYAEDEE